MSEKFPQSYVKEQIDKTIGEDMALSLEEKKKVSEFYDNAKTFKAKEEIKDYIDSLVIQGSIMGLKKLKTEIDIKFQNDKMDDYLSDIDYNEYSDDGVENIDIHFGFNDLQASFEGKGSIKNHIIGLFDNILTSEMKDIFNIKEQDNIKLVLVDIFQKEGIFNFKITRDEIKEISSISKEEIIKMEGFMDNPEKLADYFKKSPIKFLQNLGNAFYKMKPFIIKLEKMVEDKKEDSKDYSSIQDIYKKLGYHTHDGESNKEIFEKIKNDLHKKFDELPKIEIDGKKINSQTKKKAEKEAKQIIEGSSSENNEIFNKGDDIFTIIMKIISAIFNVNKDLNGFGGNKKMVSNLTDYSKSSEFPLKGKIKSEELKDLDPKKLEKYIKYLKDKDIDFNQDKFWEKVLTGKGTKPGDKLYELHKQLVINKEGDILGPKDGLKELVKTLNNVGNKQRIKTKPKSKLKNK